MPLRTQRLLERQLTTRSSPLWEERGRADGPIAFRTIVRAVIEGAEGKGDAPDQKAAANLWAWTVGGNPDALGSALGCLAETVNRDHVVTALATSPSGTFVSNYIAAFAEAYHAATVDFRAAATVGDYLGVPTAEEDRWRAALSALWVTIDATNTTPNTSRHGTEMPRLVVFHYCVSLGIVSFKRSSGVKVILPGGSRFLAGLPYTLISICAGWWGIPWGPIWTLQAIGRNLSGGTDVTELVSSRGQSDRIAGLPAREKGSAAAAEAFEPNLPPDLLEQYRQMAPRERRRLAHEAEESAQQSLSIDPTRDYVKERDAILELELRGLWPTSEGAKAEL